MKKIIIASLFLTLALTGCSLGEGLSAKKILTPEEAKAKATDFIIKNLVSEGTEVNVTEVTAEGSLYKLKVNVKNPQGSQDIDSYISNDGESFFPQVIKISETEEKAQADANPTNQQAPVAEVANKSDKPIVELFVMSHCPYGTQIEKGILPVVKALDDKIDFQLKFCDYAMHGEKEVMEQLNQYCINKEEPNKLIKYLDCFLLSSDGEKCLDEAGIDKGKIGACAKSADSEFKVSENLKNQTGTYPSFDIYKSDNAKYGVGGSPTLVINGEQVSSGRDSASLLKVVCSAFNNQPEECKSQLSSETPAPGFGSGTTAGGSDASCN